MTAPVDTEPAPAPPERAEWVTIPDPPPAETRSDTAGEKKDAGPGRPVGHWAAIGGSGAVLGGAGLFAAFGPVGLAAGACAAVGGVGLYGYHKYRKNRGPAGARQRRERTRRTVSKLNSGLGRKGKGPKLFGGGRGGKLGGKSGGPKLGKGGKSGLLSGKGGKLGGGKGGPKLGGGKGGPKLGKGGGPKLGGKSGGKFLGGKAGKLGGGGRGKGLGGKLGNGRRAASSKLGSAGKGGGKLLGRGGKAGLGLGKRGGKAGLGLGRRGGSKLGSFGRSTGRKVGGKVGGAALRTKAGRRTANGLKAATKSLKSAAPGQGRLSRWNRARQAARAKLGGKHWATRFLAAVGSCVVASAAMVGIRRKARQDEKAAAAEAAKKEAAKEKAASEATADEPLAPEGVVHEPPKGDGPTVIPGVVISSEYETPAGHPAGDAPPSTTRSSMSEFPLLVAARQVTAAAAAYRPQSMWVVDTDLEAAHEVPLAMAEAFRIYTMTLRSGYALDPVVSEALGRAYVALGEVSTSMRQVPALFKEAHAHDIAKKTKPRGDESGWNV